MARHGHDLAGLIEGSAGSDEAAGFCGGFDDDDGAGEAGDDPIARWEVAGLGLHAHGHFGNAQAVFGDIFRELFVFNGVYCIDATCLDGDGARLE